jgi:hypothetical protein
MVFQMIDPIARIHYSWFCTEQYFVKLNPVWIEHESMKKGKMTESIFFD